jgi:hypothetical protein
MITSFPKYFAFRRFMNFDGSLSGSRWQKILYEPKPILQILEKKLLHNLDFVYKTRLKAFGNRLLRRIYRPKREDVTQAWTKIHTESFIMSMLCQYY